jgi:hypothetical protein
MATKKHRYMSNVAIEGVDNEGNRFTDREVSNKPFEGRGSEYFGSGVDDSVGAGRGKVNPPVPKPKRSAAVEEAIQEMQDAKDRKKIKAMGYAKGGVTRADGCATKGRTKGTMVKMAYGGKAC